MGLLTGDPASMKHRARKIMEVSPKYTIFTYAEQPVAEHPVTRRELKV
jgi:hypothetical protein